MAEGGVNTVNEISGNKMAECDVNEISGSKMAESGVSEISGSKIAEGDVADEINAQLLKILSGCPVPVLTPDVVGLKREGYKPIPNKTYVSQAVVFNDAGHVLLIQEAKTRCNGTWYLPAGRMEAGEHITEGAQREMKEESGLEFEPTTLIYVQINTGGWIHFTFTGRVTGGKLKTLEDADKESLQAQWFSVESVRSKEIPLRKDELLPLLETAEKYAAKARPERHPACLPAIHPYQDLIHRAVVVQPGSDGMVKVLVNKKDGYHIPSSYFAFKRFPNVFSVHAILKDAFKCKNLELQVRMCGVLSLEHCGKPEGENNGFCLTSLSILDPKEQSELSETGIPELRNKDYMWYTVTDTELNSEIRRRMEEGMTVPFRSPP